MLRSVLAMALVPSCLLLGSSDALAQQPEPRPAAAATPRFTDEELDILDLGEYDAGEIVLGGLIGTVVGLGTGHAYQDRFDETGWLYMVGEIGTVGATGIAMTGCAAASEGWSALGCVAISAIAGASVLGAIKLVEIVDVWSHPFLHNRRYRELDARRRDELAWSLHVLPDSEGGVRVGLGVRF
ncbi:MAG: hypothetical protein H6748_13340 [Spirochaetaceae bacterium]|nr:hypothetical protein [Myxococcales bacterium]MCB9725027.1 hypothetical protein [Spirochaetaceae bacterium]HPG26968.1 hypothetical protein [Myxococcota bacterium]